MDTDSRLENQTLKVQQLVDDLRGGRIVIPEFQRDYVWRPKKAPKLLDSLYRKFPISSLIIWETEDKVRTRRDAPRPEKARLMKWLIDGQQRAEILSKTLDGDIEVVFSPELEEFRLANAATRNDASWVRISDILNTDDYVKLRRSLDASDRSAVWEARFESVRGVLSYDIPVVRMVGHSFDNAVEAFTRINTLGVRLKNEDIESAEVAAKHSGFIVDHLAPALRSFQSQGFKRLNIMHMFRACAFVARPDGRERTPLQALGKSEVIAAWKKTEQAVQEAINLVRSELGLVNMDIIWSGALLVPLIAMCSLLSGRERNAREMVGWLALAALCHRYSGASETALNQDLRACRSTDPVGSLLTNLRNLRKRSLMARPNDFSGTLSDKSGLLSLYIACLNRGIHDFYTGGKVLLQGNVDRHHILPRRQFPKRHQSSADNIANVAFITGSVNKQISHTGPEVYIPTVARGVRRSQCIPEDAGLWRVSASESFWRARRKLLAQSFNEFVTKALRGRHLT